MGSNTQELELQAIPEGTDLVILNTDGSKINLIDIHFFEILEHERQPNTCQDKIYVESLAADRDGAEYHATLNPPEARFAPKEEIKRSPHFIPQDNPIKLDFKVMLYNTTRMDTKNRVFQIKITDADKERFEVPLSTSDSVLPKSSNKLAD